MKHSMYVPWQILSSHKHGFLFVFNGFNSKLMPLLGFSGITLKTGRLDGPDS